MNPYTAPGVIDNSRTLKPYVKEQEFVTDLVNASMFRTNLNKVLTFDIVLDSICDVLQLNREEILSKSRMRDVVDARHIVMWTMTQVPNRLTYAKIGALMDRDHATVIHARRKVDELIETDHHFRLKFNTVMDACKRKGLIL